MSTYINEHQGIIPEYNDSPDCLKKFLMYLRTQKNRSVNTVNSYYLDVRMFMRYRIKMLGLCPKGILFDDISIVGYPDDILLEATQEDIEAFLYYCTMNLGNSSTSMARKLTSLKTFYGYLYQKSLVENNPAKEVEGPSRHRRSLPIYLTYEQCLTLLDNIDTEAPARDYCIITLLLNCGMRLSELIGIDFSHLNVDEGCIRILGKGNKERLAYLNDACVAAIAEYLQERVSYRGVIDTQAMFISRRTGKRLTARAVEKMVEKRLNAAGLGGMKFSPHKFRHTAATLMHQSGADILTIKHILGHVSTETTEIYTHLNNDGLSQAVAANPLALVTRRD